ncbi:MAG: YifB family Mg chelatase-like AAA ATPase [Anaerolineaceae bacterium]|nr:YifB family Mg chelatase-like AAA ATPase [Anaerolineaceae bacterium]
MLAHVHSCAVIGLEGEIVDVEVDFGQGLPHMAIVGLPDEAVKESRERVYSAIKNAGLTYPRKALTVNLAPATLRKEGPSFDLPIAIGVLISGMQVPQAAVQDALIIGELSLDGGVRHVRGLLAMAAAARAAGYKRLFVSVDDAPEAAMIPEIEVYPVPNLGALYKHLTQSEQLSLANPRNLENEAELSFETDFAEIRGQEQVKRAMEVAAAGGHNALMVGSPGAGKTLIARALPSILPALSLEESLEVTKIYSISDLLPKGTALIRQRPFRSPHHTISHAGLVGGGNVPHPGEISLAHRGVLFLDELPEFGQRILEVLRQPIEDKKVTISRANGTLTFPADFMLVGAMNPCPCGYQGDPIKPCTCSNSSILNYQKKISGPLLDRIDIHMHVPRVEFEKLSSLRVGESSQAIRARVTAARARQIERYQGTSLFTNADMAPAEIRRYCKLDEASAKLMQLAMQRMQLTARGYHRVLKLARTIADLAGQINITQENLAEALQYRTQQSEI